MEVGAGNEIFFSEPVVLPRENYKIIQGSQFNLVKRREKERGRERRREKA